jgi:hypothetical protein
LTVHIAELETALELRDTACVIDAMRTVTVEWYLLRADLCLLQAATPNGCAVVTMPPEMQAVRRSVRTVIWRSLAYVAQIASQGSGTADEEALSRRISRGYAAW